MTFLIREARESDATAIWELNCNEMGYQYPLNATIQKLNTLLRSECDKIFVAVSNDVVVGYIHANDYDVIYAPHMKNIMGVAVSADYQRQGIATAICDWLECHVAAECFVTHASITAKPFFEKRGYQTIKEQQIERQGILLPNYVMEKRMVYDIIQRNSQNETGTVRQRRFE